MAQKKIAARATNTNGYLRKGVNQVKASITKREEKIKMLDYTNVTEVKDFVLNILVENAQLRQKLELCEENNDAYIDLCAQRTENWNNKLVRAANALSDILDEMKALQICPQYYDRIEKIIETVDEEAGY